MNNHGWIKWMVLLGAMGVLAAGPSAAWAQATQPAKESDRTTLTADDINEFIKKTKQPVPWLKWGADARLREVYGSNLVLFNKDNPNHEDHFQRYRFRIWTTVTPVKDVDVNLRLVFEPRHYCKPDSRPAWRYEEAIWDHFNVKWTHPFGVPVTATIGRQDIILGNGWLVLDGTPWDGSRTIFFDALRLTWDLKDLKTTVDTIYIDQKTQADRHIDVMGDKEEPLTEADEHGFILYVTNKSLPKTQIDGYYIFKADNRNTNGDGGKFPVAWGWDQDIHTFGARAVHGFTDQLKGRAEFAQQVGDRNRRDVCAFSVNTRMDYFLKDKWNNNFRASYEYASGDDPGSGTDEQFDRVWGRWPQFSELYVYPYAAETRIAEVTNFHRIGGGWSCNPVKDLEVCADYNILFCDENSLSGNPGFSKGGCFRGQLLALLLKHKLNEHISQHVLTEFFFPGEYYDDTRNDPAAFLRYQVVFAW